jgi:hypothetical protein
VPSVAKNKREKFSVSSVPSVAKNKKDKFSVTSVLSVAKKLKDNFSVAKNGICYRYTRKKNLC